jgi:hypothetical protein
MSATSEGSLFSFYRRISDASKLRVSVADDAVRMRQVIGRFLKDEFEVIGEVSNGRELVRTGLDRNPRRYRQ